MSAPHQPLSPRTQDSPRTQPLSLTGRGMPLLCSLAMHGLLAAAALWLTLPKPSHAPRPEPFMTVQFVAAPPAPVAVPAPAPAPVVAPSPVQEAAAPPPAAEQVVQEPPVQEVPVQEPLVEAPPPLPAETAAEVLPPPKPVVKPKPQPRVAAKPVPQPVPPPVPPSAIEPSPKPAETPQVAAAPSPPVQTPPVEAPPAAAAPEAAASPAAAPAHAMAAAPAEIQSSEPPVLRHPGFRNRPQPPVYPVRARQLEQEGVSVVRALIDPEGQSREVRLWRSSGYEMLDQAALNAVRGWAFNAARIGERPVLAWVEIPVQFKLR
ncbi:energy transducer TonB [Ferrovibrio sp.]|uniref:energy transducer TonB n=1 Tax=Ferrovibrio sp. TaxID=1917215 RepID=UPI003D0BD4F9